MKKKLIVLSMSLLSASLITAAEANDQLLLGDLDCLCSEAETKAELNKCLEKFNLMKQQAQVDKQAMEEYYEKVIERKLRKQKEIDEKIYQERLREYARTEHQKRLALCVLSTLVAGIAGVGVGAAGNHYMNDYRRNG